MFFRQVFAPTDAAFDALPGYLVDFLTSDEGIPLLTTILTYHVLGSVVPAGAIPPGETMLPSLEGTEVTITSADGSVTVDEATVVGTDILASNGTCSTAMFFFFGRRISL
jgi:uncharacterized surface protein with fasciclin (FAS1) repeats